MAEAGSRRYLVPVPGTQTGYTLLEAALVVALLGILVALALTGFQRVIMERRVQSTAREIAGLVRAAQQAAVAKSAEIECVRVSFEASRAAVYVVPDDNNPNNFSCNGGALLVSQTYPQGVTVSPSQAQLSFLPSGEPTPQPFQVEVSGGGRTRRVCVGAAGLVTVPPEGESCQQ
ncbi:MAG: hypothetical protein C4303_00970 [candidate division GAL15 bacterium]